MRFARAAAFLAGLSFTGFLALSANAGIIAPTFDFTFTGDCDDCAFEGDPSDPGFDPIDDGFFQSVSGTLRLTDVTVNGDGFIVVSSGNFDSFDYGGSSLLNPVTLVDPFTITGLISADGSDPSELLIETSAGDFSNFCTPLGEDVLGFDGCGFIGIVAFELFTDGTWTVFGTEASDVGINGQVQPVPEPTSAALLGLGLLGAGLSRRRGEVTGRS